MMDQRRVSATVDEVRGFYASGRWVSRLFLSFSFQSNVSISIFLYWVFLFVGVFQVIRKAPEEETGNKRQKIV